MMQGLLYPFYRSERLASLSQSCGKLGQSRIESLGSLTPNPRKSKISSLFPHKQEIQTKRNNEMENEGKTNHISHVKETISVTRK